MREREKRESNQILIFQKTEACKQQEIQARMQINDVQSNPTDGRNLVASLL